MNFQQPISPHLEFIFSVSFTVRVNDFRQLSLGKLAVDPFHFLGANQDASAVELPLLELPHVFVAVTEELLSVGF